MMALMNVYIIYDIKYIIQTYAKKQSVICHMVNEDKLSSKEYRYLHTKNYLVLHSKTILSNIIQWPKNFSELIVQTVSIKRWK